MAKRRGNNEGTIYRMKNGKYRAQITIEGRRLSKVSNTHRECQDWIKQTRNQIDEGLTFNSTKITLQEFMDLWLSAKENTLRSSTWNNYTYNVQNHINPHLGKMKLTELRPDQIQTLYNWLLESGKGVPTVRKTHTILHSALTHAVKIGIISRNPASATIPPKYKPKEMKFFTDSQVSQMLVSASGHRWEALYHVAVTTGIRQMELLGLKWSDLDWRMQIIQIRRQFVRPGITKSTNVEFEMPKTNFARRTIDLGSQTIRILRTHYEKQQLERQKAGDTWHEHDLIFTNKYGGPIHPRNLLRNYKQLLREAGLPTIRFHDLRHTAASLMLNHGIPVIVVSRRLGHARASITLDVYGHLIPSMQREAAEMMDNLVTPIQLHTNCTQLHTDDAKLEESSSPHPHIQAKNTKDPCI